MAKKKGKKGKKGKKKSSISYLERERYRLLIEYIKNKIKWRKEVCQMMEEETEVYIKTCEEESADRKQSVNLLEDCIEDVVFLTKSIKSAIPDKEEIKVKVEEERSKELATVMQEIKLEKESNAERLQTFRKQLASIDAYDGQSTQLKIAEVEHQLEPNNEKSTKKNEITKQKEKALEAEMLEIFDDQSAIYQETLKGRLDHIYERIAEETRWWKDTSNILHSMKERLEQSNRTKKEETERQTNDLKLRKRNALQNLIKLQEDEKKIKALEEQNRELAQQKENETEKLEEHRKLVDLSDMAKKELENSQKELEEYACIVENIENGIKELENKVFTATQFSFFMNEVMKTAIDILEDEVKYPLIKDHADLPNEDVLQRLETFLQESSKQIYETQAYKLYMEK